MKFSCIFDFNGTLFMDTPFHLQAWEQLLNQYTDLRLNPTQIKDMFTGVPNITALQQQFPSYTLEQCIFLSHKKEEIYRQIVRNSQPKLHDGAIELFKYLKEKQIPFTICSASIRENIDFFIEIFSLSDYVNINQIVYDDGTYENKIAMFQKAKTILYDLPPIIFEDSRAGITSALAISQASIIAIKDESLSDLYDNKKIIGVIDNFYQAIPMIQKQFD